MMTSSAGFRNAFTRGQYASDRAQQGLILPSFTAGDGAKHWLVVRDVVVRVTGDIDPHRLAKILQAVRRHHLPASLPISAREQRP